MKLTREDFISGQDPRWCPGCGDYAILAGVQKTFPTLGIPREKFVFISGIGCSSRFPYYMNTYGFHTIHGRAPTIATGLKCTRPDLQVWVVTGDGDGLSIGANHLIHCMRRNVDINIILVNNRIYGLTKGQCSPTSEIGKRTKSTPLGSIAYPINPLRTAIAAEASFVARTFDTDVRHMSQVFERAAQHKGTSFVEIYQNCNIFNDKAFEKVTARINRPERMLYIEHGKPLLYGTGGKKGIRIRGMKPEIVNAEETGDRVVVHDEKLADAHYAYLLTQMDYPEFPVPFGVFRAVERPSFDSLMQKQVDQVVKERKPDLETLLHGGSTWEVKK
jgi:2-oxoglutarate/2-oxoacid ferredoxin oxidoreductase subunit beta